MNADDAGYADFVAKLTGPAPVSQPLDMAAMQQRAALNDYRDVRPKTYGRGRRWVRKRKAAKETQVG
jgi:hypothetical protein